MHCSDSADSMRSAARLALHTLASREAPRQERIDCHPDNLREGSLNEVEAKALFAKFGVRSVREIRVDNAQDAQAVARTLGGPVVLKLLSDTITHKSDSAGVAVGVPAEAIGANGGAVGFPHARGGDQSDFCSARGAGRARGRCCGGHRPADVSSWSARHTGRAWFDPGAFAAVRFPLVAMASRKV